MTSLEADLCARMIDMELMAMATRPRASRALYRWQFKNGKTAPIGVYTLQRASSDGPLYQCWDRSLGAYVFYPAR